jgi:hypothetical protein
LFNAILSLSAAAASFSSGSFGIGFLTCSVAAIMVDAAISVWSACRVLANQQAKAAAPCRISRFHVSHQTGRPVSADRDVSPDFWTRVPIRLPSELGFASAYAKILRFPQYVSSCRSDCVSNTAPGFFWGHFPYAVPRPGEFGPSLPNHGGLEISAAPVSSSRCVSKGCAMSVPSRMNSSRPGPESNAGTKTAPREVARSGFKLCSSGLASREPT